MIAFDLHKGHSAWRRPIRVALGDFCHLLFAALGLRPGFIVGSGPAPPFGAKRSVIGTSKVEAKPASVVSVTFSSPLSIRPNVGRLAAKLIGERLLRQAFRQPQSPQIPTDQLSNVHARAAGKPCGALNQTYNVRNKGSDDVANLASGPFAFSICVDLNNQSVICGRSHVLF